MSAGKAKSPQKSATAIKSNRRVIEFANRSGTITSHVKDIISALGEDPEREGLVRTPERSEKALRYLTSGYSAGCQSDC
jgi:GTP cyclohydrolase I